MCISPILSQSAHSFHNVLQFLVWTSYLNKKAGHNFEWNIPCLAKGLRTQCYGTLEQNGILLVSLGVLVILAYKLPIVFLCMLEITQSLESFR